MSLGVAALAQASDLCDLLHAHQDRITQAQAGSGLTFTQSLELDRQVKHVEDLCSHSSLNAMPELDGTEFALFRSVATGQKTVAAHSELGSSSLSEAHRTKSLGADAASEDMGFSDGGGGHAAQ